MKNGLKYGFICYELCKAANDEEMLSSTLNNIGNIYMTNDEDSLAIIYFNKSLEIERKLGRKDREAIRLGNISSSYIKTNQLPKALSAATEALKLSREDGRLDKTAIRLSQLSEVYLAMNEYTKALQYATESFDYFNKVESAYGQTISFILLGKIKQKMGNEAGAEMHFNEALELAEQEQNKLLIQQICENLYLLNRTKNPDRALHFFERCSSLKDSVFQADNQNQLNDFRAKYETQEKEYQLAISKQELKNARLIYLLSTVIVFLLIAVIAYLFYNGKRRKKQNEKLTQLNATKDKLFSIISHDLRSPLLAQKLAIDQLVKNLSLARDENMILICNKLQESVSDQIEAIENLMNWARVQTDRINYIPQHFDIVPLITDEIRLFSVAAQNKSIHIDSRLPESCVVFADRQMIIIVLRNLINNALKFTQDGGSITLSTQCNGEETEIIIADTGIGMRKEQIDTLYDSARQVEVRFGTNGEKGIGLGLSLCRDLLKKNNSRLLIESQEQKGTTIRFSLPKNQK